VVADDDRVYSVSGRFSDLRPRDGYVDKSTKIKEVLDGRFDSYEIKTEKEYFFSPDLLTSLGLREGFGVEVEIISSEGNLQIFIQKNIIVEIINADSHTFDANEFPSQIAEDAYYAAFNLSSLEIPEGNQTSCNDASLSCIEVYRCTMDEATNQRNCTLEINNLTAATFEGDVEYRKLYIWAVRSWTHFANTFDWYGISNSPRGAGFESLKINYYPECPESMTAHWADPFIEFCDNMYVLEDVMSHEYAHAVFKRATRTRSPFEYIHQGRNLNESLADIFAVAVDNDSDWRIHNLSLRGIALPLEQTLIGEINGSHQADKLSSDRYMCPSDNPSPENDNDGVHWNGNIISVAARLLSEGGNFNGVSVQGIGREQTFDLLFRTLKNKIQFGEGFKRFYQNIITTCFETYGFESNQCTSVENAFRSVEVDQQPIDIMYAPQCATLETQSCHLWYKDDLLRRRCWDSISQCQEDINNINESPIDGTYAMSTSPHNFNDFCYVNKVNESSGYESFCYDDIESCDAYRAMWIEDSDYISQCLPSSSFIDNTPFSNYINPQTPNPQAPQIPEAAAQYCYQVIFQGETIPVCAPDESTCNEYRANAENGGANPSECSTEITPTTQARSKQCALLEKDGNELYTCFDTREACTTVTAQCEANSLCDVALGCSLSLPTVTIYGDAPGIRAPYVRNWNRLIRSFIGIDPTAMTVGQPPVGSPTTSTLNYHCYTEREVAGGAVVPGRDFKRCFSDSTRCSTALSFASNPTRAIPGQFSDSCSRAMDSSANSCSLGSLTSCYSADTLVIGGGTTPIDPEGPIYSCFNPVFGGMCDSYRRNHSGSGVSATCTSLESSGMCRMAAEERNSRFANLFTKVAYAVDIVADQVAGADLETGESDPTGTDGDGDEEDGDPDDGGSGPGNGGAAPEDRTNCLEDPTSINCVQDPLSVECYEDFNGVEVCERNTIFSLLFKAIRGLTNILIPLSVLMIIYGGLQFVIARGNESKVTDAKKTFTNIIIGVTLIIGARIFIEIVNAIRLTL
jgi:hypothetical protein